jgi:hypothetical protein
MSKVKINNPNNLETNSDDLRKLNEQEIKVIKGGDKIINVDFDNDNGGGGFFPFPIYIPFPYGGGYGGGGGYYK